MERKYHFNRYVKIWYGRGPYDHRTTSGVNQQLETSMALQGVPTILQHTYFYNTPFTKKMWLRFAVGLMPMKTSWVSHLSNCLYVHLSICWQLYSTISLIPLNGVQNYMYFFLKWLQIQKMINNTVYFEYFPDSYCLNMSFQVYQAN